jgi:hypothetical protein
MQATVATFDPVTRSGTLLLDNGRELRFGAEAFAASGLRLVRSGQRLTVTADESGQVVRVSLIGID